ncbi:glycoside hydrolase family 130 protein [Bacteroidota bacterium]
MKVTRLKTKLKANPKRVILRYMVIKNELRIIRIINTVLLLPENEVEELLLKTRTEFKNRHQGFNKILINNFKKIEKHLPSDLKITSNRKLLLGAFFSMEYSIEAAALFNPSIVPHPDQTGLPEGSLRFILSLRATGEGHISSVEFRTGVFDSDNDLSLEKAIRKTELPKVDNKQVFSKSFVVDRVKNYENFSKELLDKIPDKLTLNQLTRFRKQNEFPDSINILTDLLLANYNIQFNKKRPLEGRVIFPHSETEIAGIEDVRFVKYTGDNSIQYYGTYTAYNGYTTIPQLIETENFIDFRIRTLHGKAVRDKGMALFPRKVNGKYAMITREDSESLFISFSDRLHFWDESKQIRVPTEKWEYVQIGNCGSPIETEKGWLLLTHGVGPIRKYVIGVYLLDLDDPSKVIGSLKEPLISPDKNEREGYVPNVVYSSGSLIHNGELIIPYAMSDAYSGFAKVNVEQLLNELVAQS